MAFARKHPVYLEARGLGLYLSIERAREEIMTPIDVYAVAVVAAISVGALRNWALWRRTRRTGRWLEWAPPRPGRGSPRRAAAASRAPGSAPRAA